MDGPSKILLGLEGIRALYEYGLGVALSQPLKFWCPKGDQHPVVIIPGLGTSDGSTYFIRSFLNDIGYNAHTWGLGRNLGPRQGLNDLLEKVANNIKNLSDMYSSPVSIIGWSLGGIYAREVAKMQPEHVRQVITLGTPFKGDAASTNATFLYELLSKDKSHRDPHILQKIGIAPPVPFTSMYSRTDGVVHWKCSIEQPGHMIENIEVPGASHLGLAHNPVSMYLIADRLQHSKANWQPYRK